MLLGNGSSGCSSSPWWPSARTIASLIAGSPGGRSRMLHWCEAVKSRLAEVFPVSIMDPFVVLDRDANALLESAKKNATWRQCEAQRWGEIFLCEIPHVIHGPFAAGEAMFAKPSKKSSSDGHGRQFASAAIVSEHSEEGLCACASAFLGSR